MTITIEQLQGPLPGWSSPDDDRVRDWFNLFELAGDVLSSDQGHCNNPAISRALGSDASTDPVLRKDVVEIIAQHDGSEEGYAQWSGLIVVRVADGRYAFVDAGCDTTGWDCQSGGHCIVSHSLEHLVRFGIGANERAKLGLEAGT